jgi:hypothetical protein
MCECVRGLVSFAMVNGHGRCSSVVGLSSERDLDYVRCVLTVCRRPVGCQLSIGTWGLQVGGKYQDCD